MIEEMNNILTDLQAKCLSEGVKWIVPVGVDGRGSLFKGSKSDFLISLKDDRVRYSLVKNYQEDSVINCSMIYSESISKEQEDKNEILFEVYKEFLDKNL